MTASAEQGRNMEDPRNKWFSAAARYVPPNPSRGQRTMSSGSSNTPRSVVITAAALRKENPGSQISRECSLTWAPKSVL